jgi:DNA repair exonuclease SbcCD ATPase subunit
VKEIKLNKLRLKNFKGIKSLSLDLQGRDALIYGDNATGKTTLYDAFLWLLFNKDSQGKAEFDIKTLDENNNPISGLEHEVEAELDISGEALVLKKVFREKWVKRKGSATSEFTGHTTDYFINDVPAKKKEWDARIKEITDEDTFKLLTSSRYFNEQLAWKTRRDILLSVCGDVPDADVIASKEELAELKKILGNRPLEDHRKMITARRKKINDQLEKIPVRIDEVAQNMPDISEVDPAIIHRNIGQHKFDKAAAEKEKLNLESGGQVAELTKKLREVEAEIQGAENKFNHEKAHKLNAQQVELNQAKTDANRIEREIDTTKVRIAEAEKDIIALEARAEGLRNQWHEVNSRQFSADNTCPTCGQPMPAEIIKQSMSKFNQQKATELAEISKKGKTAKAGIEIQQTKIQEWEDQINSALEKINTLQSVEEKARAKIKEIENSILDTSDLHTQKADLEKQIQALSEGDNKEAIEKAEAKIKYCDEQIEALQRSFNKIDQHKAAQERIEELKEKEKKLAAEYEEIESQIYMTEQFVRAKVNMLEEKINSRFGKARFKLFEEQINGGLTETCVTLYKGVPYPSMNNAAQINVGLDIINTLSEHYGFSCPIWIDNAEAVTKLAETNSQMIKLVVSEDHPKLAIFFKEEASCQTRKAS